jgi:hypothetical protein
MWTLFAGLVGYIIKALEERSGFIGEIILKIIGTAWSIACVFVIPVIITEEATSNPLTILKQSALTLRRTWGESLVGYVGIGFAGTLFFLVSLPVLIAGIAISVALQVYWFIVVVVLAWLAATFLWSYLLSVASQIFRCALFIYASQGALPAPYTDEMMALAWKQRK